MAALGDDVGAGRAAPPAGVSRGVRRAGVVLLEGAVLGEGVEVPADRCGRQPEEPADLGGGDGSVLGHGRQARAHACAARRVR